MKEATARRIRFCFRDDTLELLGEVSPENLGTINLTGEWRRSTNKKK